jgi:hypothetical protein
LPDLPASVRACMKESGVPRKLDGLTDAERNGVWMRIWNPDVETRHVYPKSRRKDWLGSLSLDEALDQERDHLLGRLGSFQSRREKDALSMPSDAVRPTRPLAFARRALQRLANLLDLWDERDLSIDHERYQAIVNRTGRLYSPATEERRLLRAARQASDSIRPESVPVSVVDPTLQAYVNEYWLRLDAITALFEDYETLARCEHDKLQPGVQRELQIWSEKEGLAAGFRARPPANRKNDPDEANANGAAYYAHLRRYYWFRLGPHGRRKNAVDWIEALNKIDFSPRKLFGSVKLTGGLHPEFITIIDNANKIGKSLRDSGFSDEVQSMLEGLPARMHFFTPRPLNNGNNLSAHALGKAVDVNPVSNPHLVGLEARAIDKFLDLMSSVNARIRKGLPGASTSGTPIQLAISGLQIRYAMESISEEVQDFVDENISEIVSSSHSSPRDLLRREAALSNGSPAERKKLAIAWLRLAFTDRELDRIRKSGLIDLPYLFVMIMKMAGATSGLEYRGAKDSMHFEVPEWESRP